MRVVITKLGRRPDKKNKFSMVRTGEKFIGTLYVPTDKFIEYINDNNKAYPTEWYVEANSILPKIGGPVSVGSSPFSDDSIRTSVIKSYVLGNSKDGMDKLILPSDFSRDMLEGIDTSSLKEGEAIYLTSNSLYLVQPLDT